MTEKWKEEKWAEDFWYRGKLTRRRIVGKPYNPLKFRQAWPLLLSSVLMQAVARTTAVLSAIAVALAIVLSAPAAHAEPTMNLNVDGFRQINRNGTDRIASSSACISKNANMLRLVCAPQPLRSSA